MATYLAARFSSTRKPELVFPEHVNENALTRLINLQGINTRLLLACLPLRVFILGVGDSVVTLGGACIRSFYQALIQQQAFAHVHFSLERIRTFQQTCLEIARSLRVQLRLSVRTASSGLHQESCHNQDAYIVVHFLSALSQFAVSHPATRLLAPSSPSGLASKLEDPSRTRRPLQTHQVFETVHDDQTTCSDSSLRDYPLRAGLQTPQLPGSDKLSQHCSQESSVLIRQTSAEFDDADRRLSLFQPQKDPHEQLLTPPLTPPTSASAPLEHIVPASGAVTTVEAALDSPHFDPKLRLNASESFDVSPKAGAVRDAQVGQHDVASFTVHGVHLVQSARPCASRATSTILIDQRDHSKQQVLQVAGCSTFVTPAGESKGKSRDAAAPQKSATTSDSRGKRKAGANSTLRPTKDGVDGDENDDGNDHDSDLGAGDTHPMKKSKSLPYRCPKHAANPDSCRDLKCEDWHSSDIASVTRHVKSDAKNDPQKLKRIEDLAHSKFTNASDRWRAYYLIFSDGQVTEQYNHPHWIKSSQTDQAGQMLRLWVNGLESGTRTNEHLLGCLHYVERLRSKKLQNERRIEVEEQRTIFTAKETALKNRRDNDAWFDREMAAVKNRLTPYGSFENITVQDRTAVPVHFPEHQENLLLHAGANSMDRPDEETAPFVAAHEMSPRIVPCGPPAFVAGTMAQPPLVVDYIATQDGIFYTSESSEGLANPLLPQHPAHNFILSNHNQLQQPPLSDSGYRTGSIRHNGIFDVQSLGLSIGEEISPEDYDHSQLGGFSTDAMDMQRYIDPTDVEKHRPNMRRHH